MRPPQLGALIAGILAIVLMASSPHPAVDSSVWGFTMTPVPTDTATSMPTDTPLPPTVTPLPPPTDTPLPLTATPLPSPTDTSEPPSRPETSALADPIIAKRADPEEVQAGDLIKFTITTFNPNAVEVAGVSVVDTLPAEVDYQSATTTQGAFAYATDSHTLTFAVGALAPSQVVTLVVEARVNNTAQVGQAIVNTAQLSSSGGQQGTSNPATAHVIPRAIPGTGLPPASPTALTWLLALLAGSLPVAGWLLLRRLWRWRRP